MLSEEIQELQVEIEEDKMVLHYNSESQNAQEINEIYWKSFIERHRGHFWLGVTVVLVVFIRILLKWFCGKPSLKH